MARVIELKNQIIPCISLYQPWAQHVIEGRKPWETRTHKNFQSLLGQWVGIHAGGQLDRSTYAFMSEWTRGLYTYEEMDSLPQMSVLGYVFVDQFSVLDESHSPLALIDCKNTKRFGLHCIEPHKFETPIPCKGGQGIFYFDLATGQRIKKPVQPDIQQRLF